MYFTYIIYSNTTKKFYIGSTANLEKRLLDHNNSRSKYTSTGKPWQLVWSRDFESRSKAIQEDFGSRIRKVRNTLSI